MTVVFRNHHSPHLPLIFLHCQQKYKHIRHVFTEDSDLPFSDNSLRTVSEQCWVMSHCIMSANNIHNNVMVWALVG